MQYQVPQFIEVEDKIFGPLTLQQFIYLAGGAGIVVVLISLLPLFFAIIASIPVIVFSLGLAFYKMNNRSFVEILESGVFFFLNDRLYIWKRNEGGGKDSDAPKEIRKQIVAPQQGELEKLQKIHDLALSLDVDEPDIYGR